MNEHDRDTNETEIHLLSGIVIYPNPNKSNEVGSLVKVMEGEGRGEEGESRGRKANDEVEDELTTNFRCDSTLGEKTWTIGVKANNKW